MIKKIAIALVAIILMGCKNENKSSATETPKEIAKFSPDVEDNIHQKELLMHLQKTSLN